MHSLSNIAMYISSIFLLLLLFISSSYAHQSFCGPTATTRDVACRITIDGRQNCPGPCPTGDRRYDQTPNNPAVTVRRNGWINVNTMANNHRGGFSRWTLVHVRDMYNKKKHAQNAFLYTCADLRVTKCNSKMKKKCCNYDHRDEYYQHAVRIPKYVPDGVYVLGWVWYGGGERWGDFGDYYDCMFIKIRGGPLTWSQRPVFYPGPSYTGRHGRCRAAVNRVGVCWREPCPGGGRFTKLMLPWEFDYGRLPRPITRSRFNNPWKPLPRKYGSPYVKSLTIRSSDYPGRVYTDTTKTKFAHILITRKMRTTVTCETSGRVKEVTFFVNGRRGRTDYAPPYTIAGDWVDYRTKKVFYAPWKFEIDRTYITLSCRAIDWDGVEHYRNFEISTFY